MCVLQVMDEMSTEKDFYQKIGRATMLTISANYSIMIFAGAA